MVSTMSTSTMEVAEKDMENIQNLMENNSENDMITIMSKLPKITGYAVFLSEFMQKESNKKFSFGEQSQKAAVEWNSLSLQEKLEYKEDAESIEPTLNPIPCPAPGYKNKIYVLIYQCPECGRNFNARYKLRFHVKSCGKVILCEICNKQMKTNETLQKHIRFHHNKEQSFPCQICCKKFTCHTDLRIHMNIHKGIRFPCADCDNSFSNRSNLLRHIKQRHQEINDDRKEKEK